MILQEYGVSSPGSVTLSDDFIWTDEHDWTPPSSIFTYAVDGSLIMETSVRLAGRPITLDTTDKSMAWVKRSDLDQLYAWLSVPDKLLTLQFTYPTDTRSFRVMFRTQEETPIKAVPVKGFPGPDPSDYFNVTINLQEMPA